MKSNVTLAEALVRASRPLAKKIEYSVNLLRKAEKLALAYDPADGFYLAFSGGKDSQALYHIAELAGVKFKAHMSFTSVDPPEVIRFVRRNYPEVETIKPKMSIYTLSKKKGILPTRAMRFCCKEFKEVYGGGKMTLTGIRKQESARRSKRKEISTEIKSVRKELQFDQFSEHKEQMVSCVNGKDKIILSPIIEWTEKDVWEFIKQVVKVPYCSLYDKGRTRIGCLCCPMPTMKSRLRDIREYPHVKKNWMRTIQYLIDNDKNPYHFDNAADWFDWWISGKAHKEWYFEKHCQQHLDFDFEDEQDEQGDNNH